MTVVNARRSGPSGRRILIRLPNWVGDLVMALPAVHALRQARPDATLVGMARDGHAELVRRIPALDEVRVAPTGEGLSLAVSVWRTARQLRAERYDLAIILAPSFEAAMTARLAGIPVRIGEATDSRAWLLSDRVRVEPALHRSDAYLRLAARAGAAGATTGGALRLTEADRSFAVGVVSDLGWPSGAPLVFVNPAAAKTPRAWSDPRFVRLVETLLERHEGLRVLVHEHHPFLAPDAWNRHSRVGVVRRATLVELAAVIERCVLYVGNDSGPMHLAAALGVPTIGIYGSSSPAITSPAPALVARDEAEHTAVTASLPCAPCRERFFEECPSPPTPDGRPPCLDQVTVEMVVAALDRRLLSSRGARRSPRGGA